MGLEQANFYVIQLHLLLHLVYILGGVKQKILDPNLFKKCVSSENVNCQLVSIMGLILLSYYQLTSSQFTKTKKYESINLKPPNVNWTTSTFTYAVKVFSNIRSKYCTLHSKINMEKGKDYVKDKKLQYFPLNLHSNLVFTMFLCLIYSIFSIAKHISINNGKTYNLKLMGYNLFQFFPSNYAQDTADRIDTNISSVVEFQRWLVLKSIWP